MSSEAYSELFMSLVTDAEAASEFVNGIIPRGLDQQMAKLTVVDKPAEFVEEQTIINETSPRILTRNEVIAMDYDELKSGLATGKYKIG
jgi:hypothetical protein